MEAKRCYHSVWFGVALALVLASSTVQVQNGGQNDGEMDYCVETGFRVNENVIIRTQDSRRMGARYLNETELPAKEACLTWCCHVTGCNVAIFEQKDKGSCYLFDCGPPSDFRCKFTPHHRYVSAILDTHRPTTPITGSHDRTAPDDSAGTNSRESVPADEHAADLKNLRHQRPPPAPNTDQKPVVTLPPSTTPLPVTEMQTEPEKTATVESRPEVTNTTPNVIVTPASTTSRKHISSDSSRATCSHFQFECRSSGECIAIYNACDGIPQCADGSDEGRDLGCPADAWRRFEGTQEVSKTSKPPPPPPPPSTENRPMTDDVQQDHRHSDLSSATSATTESESAFHRKEQHKVTGYKDTSSGVEGSPPEVPSIWIKSRPSHVQGPSSKGNDYDEPRPKTPAEQPMRNANGGPRMTDDTGGVVSHRMHVTHTNVNPYGGDRTPDHHAAAAVLPELQGPKYFSEEEHDLKHVSKDVDAKPEVEWKHEDRPEMTHHSNRQHLLKGHYYEDGPASYDTEHAVDTGHYGGGGGGVRMDTSGSGTNNEREYYEGGAYYIPEKQHSSFYRPEPEKPKYTDEYDDRRPGAAAVAEPPASRQRPATTSPGSEPHPAEGSVWSQKKYEDEQTTAIHEGHATSGQILPGHRRFPVGGFQSHRAADGGHEALPVAPQSKMKPDPSRVGDEYDTEEMHPSRNRWPDIPYEPEVDRESHQHGIHQANGYADGSMDRRPAAAAAAAAAIEHVTKTPSPPLVASRRVHLPDGGHHQDPVAVKKQQQQQPPPPPSPIKLSVATNEAEREQRASEASGAVLALTLGLSVTGLLLVLVGCRLRMVRRRLRRSGRSPYAHDADYLVNGMYL